MKKQVKGSSFFWVGILAFLVLTDSAHAKFGGMLDGLKEDEEVESTASPDSFLAKYVESRLNAENAELKIATALDDKKRIAAAQESIDALNSGASGADLGKILKSRGDVEFGAISNAEVTLDSDAKVVYAQGLVSLAAALVTAKEAAGMASDVASNMSGNLMSMGTAALSTAAIAKDAPEYVTKLTKALSGAVEFARNQGVEVPSDVTDVI